MSVFGFLKAVCARCGDNRGLHKIKDGEWLCLECLKEGEYKSSWSDIKTRISETYDMVVKDSETIYEELIHDAEEILELKIELDNGKITEEEYNEKAKAFFGGK